MKRRLSERLQGRAQPAGYVSFLSALVHHGALVDALAVIQVASPDRVGRDAAVEPGPVDHLMVPRYLFFGWRWEPFEGDVVPVASVEKALLDWVHHCEERGIDPRLDEIEWDVIDQDALRRLSAETGICVRPYLAGLAGLGASVHDQDRGRAAALEGAAAPGAPPTSTSS